MEEQDKSEHEEENSETNPHFWKLETLPPELFLHICSFLSANFVINVLSLVCHDFNDIIQNDATWKMRISRRWPKRYPVVPADDDFNWKEACIAREEHHRLWSDVGNNMKRYQIKEAHYAAVDAVLLLEEGRICASGGRDRSLKFWDLHALNDRDPGNPQEFITCQSAAVESAHDGWLWSMVFDKLSGLLYTGGFDNYIKSWNFEEPHAPTETYRLTSPVLCLALSNNTVVSGSYGRGVNLLDPRAGNAFQLQHMFHKGPVLCVAADEQYIISGSEDHTIMVYDRRMGRVKSTLEMDAFPMCMSYDEKQLWVGDVQGYYHTIDPAQGTFNRVKSFKSEHQVKITGIQHSLGSIATCSTDKTIRIVEPTYDPQPIAVLQCEAEVSRISSYKFTLASANTDDSISIWMPKEE